jgi:hypothetical protein
VGTALRLGDLKNVIEKTEVKLNSDKWVEGVSPTGRKSYNNGDTLAGLLQGLTNDEIFAVCERVFGEDYVPIYSHLNQGMQRMCLGNRLRKHVKIKGVSEIEKAISKLNRNK